MVFDVRVNEAILYRDRAEVSPSIISRLAEVNSDAESGSEDKDSYAEDDADSPQRSTAVWRPLHRPGPGGFRVHLRSAVPKASDIADGEDESAHDSADSDVDGDVDDVSSASDGSEAANDPDSSSTSSSEHTVQSESDSGSDSEVQSDNDDDPSAIIESGGGQNDVYDDHDSDDHENEATPIEIETYELAETEEQRVAHETAELDQLCLWCQCRRKIRSARIVVKNWTSAVGAMMKIRDLSTIPVSESGQNTSMAMWLTPHCCL